MLHKGTISSASQAKLVNHTCSSLLFLVTEGPTLADVASVYWYVKPQGWYCLRENRHLLATAYCRSMQYTWPLVQCLINSIRWLASPRNLSGGSHHIQDNRPAGAKTLPTGVEDLQTPSE